MHAVVRTYSGKGAKELIDLVSKSKPDAEKLIAGIKGFVAYYIVRNDDGGATISIFQDKAGTDESVRVAREWVVKNGAQFGAAPPTVTEGTVTLSLK
jgi:hypothetical protein